MDAGQPAVYRAPMDPPINFRLDFSSPYPYIANGWIDALAYPSKGECALRDFARSARCEGLPYKLPPVFTRGMPLHEMAARRELAAEHGLDPAAVEAVCNDPACKARLKREVDAAIAAGHFGAPCFMVDGEPFWGNDRRPQIERWLARGPL